MSFKIKQFDALVSIDSYHRRTMIEKAKSIISPNKFKEEDYECTDPEILEILSYYRITRDIAERNN